MSGTDVTRLVWEAQVSNLRSAALARLNITIRESAARPLSLFRVAARASAGCRLLTDAVEKVV
jgi:hypothetical protein